ncbi:hypothetical protein GM418_06675 [Maribellus comscasis]|uniref:Carboxypeptidase-like regulatory domain-containing protein n=1 Tax=Maribellus comscasis TaxID=2681766 RepID=A0A6I6JVR1_9BACT|nr:DUF5686 and carboxypeptidase-like regulatory domain-containing protein [Maribellus comscasis]QGY43353.1 hypothetical protein GM418_06675 [Maribellus comscasis]
MIKKILSQVLFLLLTLLAAGQKTDVSGKITDAGTGEPIPYANIIFKGTYIGTMSDVNGNYQISTAKPTGEIDVSAIGYKKQSASIKMNESNKIDFVLEEEVVELGEIKILPGENPANILLRKIVDNKDRNNPDNFLSWNSQIYSKIEFDIKNVKSSLKDKKLLEQFAFVFDYIDSMEIQGKTFLPVFFNETVSSFYHDAKNKKDREEIIANKASGMTIDMFSQFTGKMYEDVNIYENYITFSDIGLISPVNNLGLQFYKYYLLDSAQVNGSKIYEVSFKPKLPQEPVFKGKFWVEDGSFALTKLEMQLSEKANVNFVNNLQYKIEFEKTDSTWTPRNESIIADVDLQKDKNSKHLGVIVRKNNIYEHFKFGSVAKKVETLKEPITVTDGVMDKSDDYWEKTRPVELQQRESDIYEMVDSVVNLPIYNTAQEIIHTLYYGYVDLGKIELGPYYYMYSKNKVEGNRFRFGARTTYDFDTHFRFNAYGAYGTLDDKFKYGGGLEYFFSVKPLDVISLQAKHDMEMLGKSDNAFMEENFMTTLLSKRLNSKLNMTDRVDFLANHEWRLGVSSEFGISYAKFNSAPYVPFLNQAGEEVPYLKSGEIKLGMRYAPGEDIVQDDFDRSSFANYDPTFMLSATKGIKGFLGGDYNYWKVNAGFSDRININPIGFSMVYLQAGKIWGDVPFPFLKIHEGNETYAYDTYAFNMMNYQEFISDTYASIFWEHHFVGFFLNKMPLFRKLKWREIAGMRSLWGSYNGNHENSLLLPGEMKGLGGMPYTEFSLGLENILKVIRVDGVWRFNYNDDIKRQFGIFVMLKLTL